LTPPRGWNAIRQGLAGELTAPREMFAAADRRLIGAVANPASIESLCKELDFYRRKTDIPASLYLEQIDP